MGAGQAVPAWLGRLDLAMTALGRAQEVPMTDRDFAAQIQGYSLTTAEILYRLPDFPGLVQTFIWQDYDLAPKFPRLLDFLDYWQANLDGPLHRVRVTHRQLVSPTEFHYHEGRFILH
jgi:uncharacterized protein Usg